MILYPPLYICSNGIPRDVQTLLALRTQGFGNIPNPNPYGSGGHNGYDWGCPTDTRIYAMHDGYAGLAVEEGGYGNFVSLVGDGVKTYYAHLDRPGKLGHVRAGEVIGYSDNTGMSIGPHLHVTCKLLDVQGNVLNRDNGHDGAVDFAQYLVWRLPLNTGMTADEVKTIYKVLRVKDYTQSDVDYWTDKYWLDMLRQGSHDYADDLNNI